MKIVNECCFETKTMKDLNTGEVFMYGYKIYMRIADRSRCYKGYDAVNFNNGEIKEFPDPNAVVRVLDVELHIKSCQEASSESE